MKEELSAEMAELRRIHSGLTEIEERTRETVVSGELPFEASHEGLATITESFDIELFIPEAYPSELPWVRETGTRIDCDYRHVFQNGRLCLAVPVEERRIFARQPSLLGFVNRLVVPYLYGYCYWKEFGQHPFGEQSHGAEGIADYYVERLELDNDLAALAVVASLLEHGYRGHHRCPCGSGKIVRKCHGAALRELHEHHTPETLGVDFRAVLEHVLSKDGVEGLSRAPALNRQVRRLLGAKQVVGRRRGRPGSVGGGSGH